MNYLLSEMYYILRLENLVKVKTNKLFSRLPLRSESKVIIVFQYVIKVLTTSVAWSASMNTSLSARTNQWVSAGRPISSCQIYVLINMKYLIKKHGTVVNCITTTKSVIVKLVSVLLIFDNVVGAAAATTEPTPSRWNKKTLEKRVSFLRI